MKKSLFLLIFSIASLSVFSQTRIAIVGGPHSSSVQEKNDVPGFNDYSQGFSNRFGAHFGILADVALGRSQKLYFQPGVIFHHKGRKFFQYDSISTSPIQTYSYNQQVNYVDLPLNLVFKLPIGTKARFIAGAGPYISAFYNGKVSSETFYKNGDFVADENDDLPVGEGQGKYAVINYGVGALAGVEFGRLFLTLNASQGLNDFYQSPDYEGSFRHRVIGGTLGIFLGQKPLPPAPKDSDKDGIPDTEDACPQEPGTALTQGCPDRDGDGVADKDDQCPDVAGLAKYQGCPIPDTDGDGVNDEEDQCPQTAGLAKYKGCPIPDTDGDGVNDEEDRCPQVAGLARYDGCPIPDTDKDGINDEEDRCPEVPGVIENAGCPAIAQEIVEEVDKAARKIQFNVNKAVLTPESYSVLDDVIAILKKDESLKLTIEGHTSADGHAAANLLLSQQRADAVKTYLESKNIDSSRLTTVGLGSSQPLNNGNTPAERALNRRVVLKLSN